MREKITFVIPAYNAEKTIERTIESILHQTDGRYKIVIVNDGSTDDTDVICRKYQEKYAEKITYIAQENRGQGGARNHGLKSVVTDYVSFLDSDDWLMPDYVEKILSALEKSTQQKAEIILTLPQIYHEESNAVRAWYDEPLFREIFTEDGVIINPQEEQRIYQFEVNQCRKVLHMDFVREVQFQFRERIKWEDVYPHFYLLSKCKICMGVPSVGFYYRIGAGEQTTASRGKNRLDFLTVIEDMTTYVQEEKRYDLCFPMMRVIVRFAIWGIRVADTETREQLVQEYYRVFRNLPDIYEKALKQETKKNYSKADALQYRLFILAIKHRCFNFIFKDYLYQDIGEKLVKKVLRAGQRVA